MNEVLVPDFRWGDCGQAQEGSWLLAWAQLIGVNHPSLSEDSVAHHAVELNKCGVALSFAVADGVGGGARGDVASRALVEHCLQAPKQLFGSRAGLAAWMSKAEGEVQLNLRGVSLSPGAATVVAGWFMPDGSGHYLRVGDTRAYCYDKAPLSTSSETSAVRALTIDQTYAHVKEEPPQGGSLDDPARMVGTGFMGEPEIESLQLTTGQVLLLCSDGLHRGINEMQMEKVLGASCDLVQAARDLVAAAREQGSTDDISVLLVQRKTITTKTNIHHSWKRLKHWWTMLRKPL